MTPTDIFSALRKDVIGQDRALQDMAVAIYKHLIEHSVGNVLLIGNSGTGKTTIMRMLCGYLEPSAGQVEIDGLDLEAERQAVQARIGYLPENDPLYPEMTVIDYLDYAASLHRVPPADRAQRIREAIDRTELGAKATAQVGTLSRGYRQRLPQPRWCDPSRHALQAYELR